MLLSDIAERKRKNYKILESILFIIGMFMVFSLYYFIFNIIKDETELNDVLIHLLPFIINIICFFIHNAFLSHYELLNEEFIHYKGDFNNLLPPKPINIKYKTIEDINFDMVSDNIQNTLEYKRYVNQYKFYVKLKSLNNA